MNVSLAVFIGLMVAMLLNAGISSAQALYDKSDYLQLTGREVGLSSGCSFYSSVFASTATADSLSKATIKNEWVGSEYLAPGSAGSWEYLRPDPRTTTTYGLKEVCVDHSFVSNLTGKEVTVKLCHNESVPVGEKVSYVMEWAPYSWNTSAGNIRFCAQLRPMLGARAVEHIPEINGYKFTEYDWWNSSWSYSKPIYISNNPSSTTLSNFTVMVHLTAANFNFSHAQSSGYDVRFLWSDNLTELPYEIEKWNSTAQDAVLWIKVPNITGSSSSGLFYIYSGNPTAGPYAASSRAWDDYYRGVWHNADTSALTDSTSYGHNLTMNGNPAQDAASIIGNGIYFDGAGDYYRGTNDADFNGESALTAQAWVRQSSLVADDGIFGKTSGGGDAGFLLKTSDTASKLRGSIGIVPTNYYKDTAARTAGLWYLFTMTYDGDTMYVYLNNDTPQAEGSMSGGLSVTTNAVEVGEYGQSAGSQFTGYIDEVRFSKTVRSADWIMTEWYSQNDTLLSFGAESSAPINYTPPTPAPEPSVNDTVRSYCFNNDTLYERVALTSQNGSYVMNSKYTTCSYGCGNWTLITLGSPGCVESPLLFYILLIAVAVMVTLLIVWLGRRT